MNPKEDLVNKKENKQNYSKFYKNNLKYYITGFSIAVGFFFILFVLGFINVNKQPNILNNPKTINYTSDNSFLDMITSQTTGNNIGIITSKYLTVKENTNEKEYPYSIIDNSPIYFHIGEKQIPKYANYMYIAKKQQSDNIKIGKRINSLRIPEINTNKIKDGEMIKIDLSLNDGYTFSIDFNEHIINFTKDKQESTTTLTDNQDLSESQIKKIIRNRLSDHGLPTKYYGEPEIEKKGIYWYLKYPELIDNKKVWGENGDFKFFEIIFNTKNNQIEGGNNYDINSYLLSEHKINKTKKEILNSLEDLGNIDTSKKGKEGAISMTKGEIILLEKGEYLIPAIIYQISGEKKYINYIITPLIDSQQ